MGIFDKNNKTKDTISDYLPNTNPVGSFVDMAKTLGKAFFPPNESQPAQNTTSAPAPNMSTPTGPEYSPMPQTAPAPPVAQPKPATPPPVTKAPVTQPVQDTQTSTPAQPPTTTAPAQTYTDAQKAEILSKASASQKGDILGGGDISKYAYLLSPVQEGGATTTTSNEGQQTETTSTAPSETLYGITKTFATSNKKQAILDLMDKTNMSYEQAYQAIDTFIKEKPDTATSQADYYKKLYGVDIPTAPKAKTPEDYLAEFGLTNDQIQAQLQSAKNAIKQKYDLLKEEAKTTTQNEFMSNLSGLYSLGEVNPLSSGTGSIDAASQNILDKRLAGLSAQEAEEMRQAEADAYNRKMEGAGLARQAALDEEARIQQEYDNMRQQMVDIMSLVQSGKQSTMEDKQYAQDTFKTLIEVGGSKVFEGFTDDDYAALDASSGFPKGTTKGIAIKIKENEIKGNSNIQMLDDGSVVNLTQDKDGKWNVETLIKAPEGTDFIKAGDRYIKTDAGIYDTVTETWVDSIPGGTEGPGVSYGASKAELAVNDIDSIIPQINNWTAGFGGKFLSQIGGTAATDLNAALESLEGKIAFGELQAMKNASKTGGALGQVSEKELALLSGALKSLRQDQSPQQLISNLNEIKKILNNWYDIVDTYGVETSIQPQGGSQEEIQYLMDGYGLSYEEAQQLLFNNESQTSLNGQTSLKSVKGIKDGSKVSTSMGQGYATGIEGGSKYWKYGLDIVLNNDTVKSPFKGIVISAKEDGAWGKSVKVLTPSGQIVRFSHLHAMAVKPGDKIGAGKPVGVQGATGKVYSTSGGTGKHLDLTIYGKDGKPYSSQQVAAMIGTKMA